MTEGTITRINEAGGYGFIEPRGCGENVFFHANDLDGLDFDEQLVQRRVLYKSIQQSRGPRATVVRPLR